MLIDGEVRIFESTVIMEYLEERWPETPLPPRDPADRAFARLTEDVCDTHYEAVNWGVGEIFWYKRASGALADRLKAEAVRQTAILQAWLTERLGTSPWFGGAAFGWADAAAAPMVNRSVHYGIGPTAGSPLATWHFPLVLFRVQCAASKKPPVLRTKGAISASAVRNARSALP